MFPRLGHGVGLRNRHYGAFLEQTPKVDFVEAISENFMGLGGRPWAVIEKVRRDRPVVLHGVSLAIGSVDPLDHRYLKQWRELVRALEPAVVSDHLCWGRAHGNYSHDLWPMPYTEESLAHVVERVSKVQDVLGRRLLLENVSSYLQHVDDELPEWDFLSEVARRADCGILLDVNNVYVSSRNHGFDAKQYLDAIPVERVGQYHLAHHLDRGSIIIDTHEGHVCDEVWALYRHAVKRFGDVSCLIEWDEGVPELEVLLAEATRAKQIAAEVSGPPALPLASTAPATVTATGEYPERLAALQQQLWDWFAGSAEVKHTSGHVRSFGALSADERVAVYSEMYWLRLRDVLRDEFPMVRAVLGDDDFDVLVAKYLKAYPSMAPSLGQLGQFLASFLNEFPVEGVPWLMELAELEYVRSQSFIAENAPTVTREELARAVTAETAERARFTIHPSVHLLQHRYDVRPLFRALDDRRDWRAVTVENTPICLAVFRQGFAVYHQRVPDEEGAALEAAIAVRAPLPELCECFASAGDAAATKAFEAIAHWVDEGFVSRIEA